jgi:hypothetical protein
MRQRVLLSTIIVTILVILVIINLMFTVQHEPKQNTTSISPSTETTEVSETNNISTSTTTSSSQTTKEKIGQSSGPSPSLTLNYDVLDKERVLKFYHSQLVKEVELLRASTGLFIKTKDNVTIYISNDNVLASKALEILGDKSLSFLIEKSIEKYKNLTNCLIYVLFGRPIPLKVYRVVTIDLGKVYSSKFKTEMFIKSDICDYSTIVDNWEKYADLVAYQILNSLLRCNKTRAEELFLKLVSLWDGYGFRDDAYNGTYAVYKCALFVYVYRALEASGVALENYKNILDTCLYIIKIAQDNLSGGIHTDYKVINGTVVISGDVNVETTSFVVIALYSNYPQLFASVCEGKTMSTTS